MANLFEIVRSEIKKVLAENYNNEERPNLYTKRGTVINRHKDYGVAKKIGGELYLHKNYVNRVCPEMYEEGLSILRKDEKLKDFNFNLVVFPEKLQKSTPRYVKFINCVTFDTDREPLRGEGYKVNLDDCSIKRMSADNTIYHHKWLWVDDDYDGFNVDDSYNWSKEWLGRLETPANGNSLQGWNAQLDKYNLKHDREA